MDKGERNGICNRSACDNFMWFKLQLAIFRKALTWVSTSEALREIYRNLLAETKRCNCDKAEAQRWLKSHMEQAVEDVTDENYRKGVIDAFKGYIKEDYFINRKTLLGKVKTTLETIEKMNYPS